MTRINESADNRIYTKRLTMKERFRNKFNLSIDPSQTVQTKYITKFTKNW